MRFVLQRCGRGGVSFLFKFRFRSALCERGWGFQKCRWRAVESSNRRYTRISKAGVHLWEDFICCQKRVMRLNVKKLWFDFLNENLILKYAISKTGIDAGASWIRRGAFGVVHAGIARLCAMHTWAWRVHSLAFANFDAFCFSQNWHMNEMLTKFEFESWKSSVVWSCQSILKIFDKITHIFSGVAVSKNALADFHVTLSSGLVKRSAAIRAWNLEKQFQKLNCDSTRLKK